MYDPNTKTISLFLQAEIDRIWVVRTGDSAGSLLLSVSPSQVTQQGLRPVDLQGNSVDTTEQNVMNLRDFLHPRRKIGYALVVTHPSEKELRLARGPNGFIWTNTFSRLVMFDSEGEVELFRHLYSYLFKDVTGVFLEVRKKLKESKLYV
jgi:hypothetical protein